MNTFLEKVEEFAVRFREANTASHVEWNIIIDRRLAETCEKLKKMLDQGDSPSEDLSRDMALKEMHGMKQYCKRQLFELEMGNCDHSIIKAAELECRKIMQDMLPARQQGQKHSVAVAKTSIIGKITCTDAIRASLRGWMGGIKDSEEIAMRAQITDLTFKFLINNALLDAIPESQVNLRDRLTTGLIKRRDETLETLWKKNEEGNKRLTASLNKFCFSCVLKRQSSLTFHIVGDSDCDD